MKRVVVHIDRLVLNGFQRADRHAIAAGLQSELGRLLSEPGAAERLGGIGNVERVRAGNIQVAPSAKPESTGVSAARAITRGPLR
jgi:hypothetical protein